MPTLPLAVPHRALATPVGEERTLRINSRSALRCADD
jgi:hypothetical protein